MAPKKPKKSLECKEDMAPEWPMINTYINEYGFLVKVYKTAYALTQKDMLWDVSIAE